MMDKKTRGKISTRDRVLEIIKKQGSVSVKELTNELGITPMGIRGHLLKLEKEKLIQSHTEKIKMGRPRQLFTLTDLGEQEFPKKYEQFALDLLGSLEEMSGRESVDKLFHLKKVKTIERYTKRLEGLSHEDRVKEYATLLSEDGYMADSRQAAENIYYVSVHNCTIRSISESYAICCQDDMDIFKTLFPDASISREKNQLSKDPFCLFKVEFQD